MATSYDFGSHPTAWGPPCSTTTTTSSYTTNEQQDDTDGHKTKQTDDQHHIPYAPFDKRAYLGKMADWSARAEQYRERRAAQTAAKFHGKGAARGTNATEQLAHANDADAASNEAFAYAEESAEGFSLMGAEAKFIANFEKKNIVQPAQNKWKKSMAHNQQFRWNDRRDGKFREASVDVRPEWSVKGQYTFSELGKVELNAVPEPTDVVECGTLRYYDKAFDRLNPKADKSLEPCERSELHLTTSDDPEIQRLAADAAHDDVKVFATDTILAVLMAAPRSVASWDIIVNRVGDRVIFDKREATIIDSVTCNESADDFADDDPESINYMGNLVKEATAINRHFSQQVLLGDDAKEGTLVLSNTPATPMAALVEPDAPPLAPVAYRYRMFNVGNTPDPKKPDAIDDRVKMIVRTQLDAAMKGKQEEDLLLRLYALNEVDAKLTNGIDWRQKIESQRGAVLATELKNNSAKLARWTIQAMLASADIIKLGFVSRHHPGKATLHKVLGTQTYKTSEFATQISLNTRNAWGILKQLVDFSLQLGEGRYLLLRDPNKPVIRFYTLPQEAFQPRVPSVLDE